MTENVSKCAPLGKLGFECLWDVCVCVGGYCWQSLGGREKAKGEARVRQVKDILKGLWTTTEKSPPAALGELPDSKCSRQWAWHLGLAGKTQAPSSCTLGSEEAGKVPTAGWQDNQTVFDIFFCKLSPGSAAAVLAFGFMPNSLCSCPRTGCEAATRASYPPSWGIPHLFLPPCLFYP